MRSRVYLCDIGKQTKDIGFNILDTNLLDSFEDAIKFGKNVIEYDCKKGIYTFEYKV